MVALLLILVGIILAAVLISRFIFNKKSADEIIDLHRGSQESQSIFVKKYKEADLDYYRGLFLRIGFIISLGIVLLAFTWTTYDNINANMGDLAIPDDIEVEPPQTKQEKPPPPPPPPPQIEVVEDEEILEDEPEIEDMEIEEDTEIEMPDIPEEEPVAEEPEIFTIVEKMPQFPGGEAEMMKFIYKNIKYPPIARENNIEGLVVVTFVVGKDGSINDIKVLRDIGGGCGEESVRVVKKMPKWNPGKQRGKPVQVQFNLPVKFKLQ